MTDTPRSPRGADDTTDEIAERYFNAIDAAVRFAVADGEYTKEYGSELRALLASLREARQDSARYQWIRDNAQCGLTPKAPEDALAMWSFFVPLRKGATDWLGAGIDTAMSAAHATGGRRD